MALMKGIYVDTEGKEHIVDLKLNADGKLEISGLQVDTLEMGSLQIASGSDASELQITNGAAMVAGAVYPFTFQDAVSTPGSGSEFDVGNYKTLLVEITGTATAQTVLFSGAGPSGTFIQVQGVRLSDNAMASQSTTVTTNAVPELWQFDITGLKKFRTNLTVVTGGAVTIKGTAVS